MTVCVFVVYLCVEHVYIYIYIHTLTISPSLSLYIYMYYMYVYTPFALAEFRVVGRVDNREHQVNRTVWQVSA